MVILREVKQINDKLAQLFGKQLFDDNDEKFISSYITDEEMAQYCEGVGDISQNRQGLDELAELIFQLRDYIPALCNLVKMFLYTRNFDAVYIFVSRLFVAHVGTIPYQSQASYSIMEKYFDRFIEIVINCNISHELYMPLLLKIFQSEKNTGIALWKGPALEYLQTLFNKNETFALDFLKNNTSLKYELLEAVSGFNAPKGISLALEDFCAKENVDKVQVIHLLKKYKREALSLIDKELIGANDERRLSLVEILCEFDNDVECISRLNELYQKEKNEEIKGVIASKIGVVESFSIKNEKQYILAVRKNVEYPQERSLNLGFDKLDLRYSSGYETDNAGKTFLIYLFKQEKNLYNLIKLEHLKTIFNPYDLSNFAYKLFSVLMKKDDINQAKWLIRMTAILVDDSKLEEIIDFAKTLKQNDRIKELKYLTECFVYAKRIEAVEFIKVLSSANVEKEIIENYVSVYSKLHDKDEEEILDFIVPDEYTKERLEEEKSRLFLSFIAGRVYTEELFDKTFIEKSLFNELGQGLVFGEYVLGNLYSAFTLKGNEKQYIVGQNLTNDKKVISIIHHLDLDARFEGLENYIQNPTFKQFTKSRFNVNEFSRNSISVNSFCGMFVSLSDFCEQMEKYGFVINKAYDEIEFSSLIHIMKNLGICAELLFDKNVFLGVKSGTLAEIHFMQLNDILTDKNKYLTTRANAISVGALPYRYFDYVLNAIYECAHNNVAN